jgi:hypothetical protein
MEHWPASGLVHFVVFFVEVQVSQIHGRKTRRSVGSMQETERSRQSWAQNCYFVTRYRYSLLLVSVTR